jgi:hypothetical protein
MAIISEAFSELDWDEPEMAQQQRDQRLAELTAQGMICSTELLYRISDGRRVYVVTAESPEPEQSEGYRGRSNRTGGDRPRRRPPGRERDRSSSNSRPPRQ